MKKYTYASLAALCLLPATALASGSPEVILPSLAGLALVVFVVASGIGRLIAIKRSPAGAGKYALRFGAVFTLLCPLPLIPVGLLFGKYLPASAPTATLSIMVAAMLATYAALKQADLLAAFDALKEAEQLRADPAPSSTD